MTIAICGSMKFYQEMRIIKERLEAFGHVVLAPVEVEKNEIPIEAMPHTTNEEKISAKIEYDFIREHFTKIQKSDAILVLNYEKNGIPGYIGGNTFLEMGHAFGLGKKIFLMNVIPSMEYSVEMHAMQPIILYGDVKKIS